MTDPSQAQGDPGELVYWWSPRGDERVFDLQGWPDEAVSTAKALLEQDGLEHEWEGTSLVVAADKRDDAAALLDEIVAATQLRLDAAADRTAYDLTDWPDYELETLRVALEDAGIVFEWTEDSELLVYEADEARVDELFERLDLRGPNPGIELDGEALTTLLTNLFVAAGTLAEDPDHADAVLEGHRAILELEQLAVPYGMNADGWRVLVADAVELRRLVEADASEVEVGTAGRFGDDLEQGEDLEDTDAPDDADEDAADADQDGDDGDEEEVMLYGDDAIMAVAARLRDRLKRLL